MVPSFLCRDPYRTEDSRPWPLGSGSRRAYPARLGDVQHDAVRAPKLHLHVGTMVVAHSESLFDVAAPLGAGRGELVEDRLETLDLEAAVVDAAETTASLDAGRLIVLAIQDGQGHVAIA